MLDGLFHADLQGRPDDPASVTLSWDALLVIMGSGPPTDGPARRDDVVRLLTTAPENPVSMVSSVTAAREGARTLRDTISAEMWESVNTFQLLLGRQDLDAGLRPARTRSTASSRSGARCSGASPRGRCRRTTRGPSSSRAGGSRPPTWCCGCSAWRSPPPRPRATTAPRRRAGTATRSRCSGRSAASRPSCAPLAAPPNASPGLFVHALRARVPGLGGVVARVARGAMDRVEGEPQDSPPVLRVRRLLAEMDFRARVFPGPGRRHTASYPSDPAGARKTRCRDRRTLLPSKLRGNSDGYRMRFALRYETEYRYSAPVFDQHNSLRVKPASGPHQRVRNFRLAVDPSARTRTYRDYFGTEVVDFNVPGEHERLQSPPRPRSPPRLRRSRPPAAGSAPAARSTRPPAASSCCGPSDEPPNGTLNQLIESVRAAATLARRSRPSAR